eukprot:gene5965-4287_t
MNRSQINNDGVLRSTTIICPSCRSNEFYRDAQSGIVCIYCGLEMPNFLLESQEEAGRGDEEGEVVFGSRRLLRTAQKAKVQRSTFRVSVAELLSIYQYCLILMTKELARLLSVNDAQAASLEADFLRTAKSLWVEYLGRWKNCPTPCKIEGIFYKHFFTSSNNRFCRCVSPFDVSNHPCFPTKPLLLGFLGLILRLHRSSCIPADLVRFCDRGLLPYHNLWESLPEHVRQPIEHSHYTRFFTLKHPGRLTPMNVWYHVTSLADALRIALPPLNTPAVALSLIHGLGLPEDEVWPTYVQVAHLWEDCDGVAPLVGLQPHGQHDAEAVMVAVLFACLLCAAWTDWSLSSYAALAELSVFAAAQRDATIGGGGGGGVLRSDFIEAVPSPVDAADVDVDVPRKLLPTFLRQSRLLLSDVQRRHTALPAAQAEAPTAAAAPVTAAAAEESAGADAAATTTTAATAAAATAPLHRDAATQLRPVNSVVLHLLEQLQATWLSEGGGGGGSHRDSSFVQRASQLFPHHAEAASGAGAAGAAGAARYFSKSVAPEAVVYSGQWLYASWLSREERRYLRVLDGRPTHRVVQRRAADAGHSHLRHFASFARHSDDATGQRPRPFTLLVERAAKFLYAPPLLLQLGLDALDRQVAQLVVEEQGGLLLAPPPPPLKTEPQSQPPQPPPHDPQIARRIASAASLRWARSRRAQQLQTQIRAAEQRAFAATDADGRPTNEARDSQRFARYRDRSAKWLPLLHALAA